MPAVSIEQSQKKPSTEMNQIIKNTIGDGGITALYAAYTVDMVDTVYTVITVDMVYTVGMVHI